MGPESYAKAIEKYAKLADPTDPFFTLVLANNGMADRLMQVNPGLDATWPTHVSYLLMNSQICDQRKLASFLVDMSKLIAEVRCAKPRDRACRRQRACS